MARQNVIEYFLFASAGNATDFGDLTEIRGNQLCAVSDGIRALIAGGADASANTAIIDRIVIASNGNATDFGDLTEARHGVGGCSSNVYGVWAGGAAQTNIIDYVTITTAANATDFGDLLETKQGISGASGD